MKQDNENAPDRPGDRALSAEERFRILSELTSDFAYSDRVEPDGQLVAEWISDAVMRVTGYTAGEISDRGLRSIVHPDDWPIVRAHIRKVLSGRSDVSESRIITKSGDIRWLRNYARPLWDETQGRVVRVYGAAQDITDQIRAAEARAVLASIVEASDDAIIGTNANGDIISWNGGAERLYGYSAAETLGRPISIHMPPDRANEFPLILERLTRGERIDHYETERKRKDGEMVSVSLTISPLKDAAGNIYGAAAIARDITGHKRKERAQQFISQAGALLETVLGDEAQLEAALAAAAELAAPYLADHCAIHLIDGAAPSGLDDSEGGTAAQTLKRALARVLASASPEIWPDPFGADSVTAVNDARLSAYMIAPLLARGRILGAITFAMAESGRRYRPDDLAVAEELARRAALAIDNARLFSQAQEAIRIREEAVELHRNIEERLALLVEASDTLIGSPKLSEVLPAIMRLAFRLVSADAYAVWRVDPAAGDWRIVSAEGLSAAFRSVSARDATPPQGILAIEDVHDAAELYERGRLHETEGIRSLLIVPLRISGRVSGSLSFYFRRPHQFGEIETRVATALGNMAAAAIGAAELYEEQSRLRYNAEAASRTKDEFLATVSHELRTPLNAILGWASILRRGGIDEEDMARALEVIERNARSQVQLIEDLLDVSAIITGRMRLDVRPVNLPSVIETAVDAIRPAARAKEIALEVSVDDGPSEVAGDASRLQQIVWNLLANAVKFTPAGGRVEVKAASVDPYVEITVSDSGVGIAPEFLPFVFDRFRQADSSLTREHGGLGLGLAIVRHLVELHGGQAEALAGGEGAGATFRVRLPRLVRDARRLEAWSTDRLAAVAPYSAVENALTGLRLLIVEDEPDAREVLSVMLRQCGAEVTAVGSVAVALELHERLRPDVLLSDIEMPEEDGYLLIRKVRELPDEAGGRVPAIALTGHARDEDRERALSAGFDAHIAKPVDIDEMAAVIMILARGSA